MGKGAARRSVYLKVKYNVDMILIVKTLKQALVNDRSHWAEHSAHIGAKPLSHLHLSDELSELSHYLCTCATTIAP